MNKKHVLEWFEVSNEERLRYEEMARYLLQKGYYHGSLEYPELAELIYKKTNKQK